MSCAYKHKIIGFERISVYMKQRISLADIVVEIDSTVNKENGDKWKRWTQRDVSFLKEFLCLKCEMSDHIEKHDIVYSFEMAMYLIKNLLSRQYTCGQIFLHIYFNNFAVYTSN